MSADVGPGRQMSLLTRDIRIGISIGNHPAQACN
jgi:hypothetical protein